LLNDHNLNIKYSSAHLLILLAVMNIKPYLKLMRPANIITAMADIMAGFAVATMPFFLFPAHTGPGAFIHQLPLAHLLLLLLSTTGLYGGGVVMNDVFDAELDVVERPERPIPSGRVSKSSAATLGIALLGMGILLAWLVSLTSGLIALSIALLAVLYDRWGKHTFLGPINMGLCRGGNLLLGISTTPFLVSEASEILLENGQATMVGHYWYLALIPIAYIAAITTISRGEVHGGNKSALYLAFALYGLVILSIGVLGVNSALPIWHPLPFLALFVYLIFPPLARAFRDRQPRNIGLAVKAGVIALIVMDAAIAASFAGWMYGLLVLALLPISRYLARIFAVT
jgi:4-hydroxybenzoate polyprenyltransferase